jgi:hypothetical protein
VFSAFFCAGRHWHPASAEEGYALCTSRRRRARSGRHKLGISGQKFHLENGRAVRYSDRMSTPCAAAAPSRYPPREAHSPPAASGLVTARRWPARSTGSPGCRPSGFLGGAAAGGSTTRSPNEAPCRPVASRQHDRRHSNSNTPNNFGLVSPKTHQATPRRHATELGAGRRSRKRLNHKEPKRSSLFAPSPRGNTTNDAPTPTRPTTSALCRQKRIRRHQATRDTIRPATRRRGVADKTDCARGGQQNSVGPLGQHGPLAKTRARASRLCRLCRLSLHRRRQWRRRRDDLLFLVA